MTSAPSTSVPPINGTTSPVQRWQRPWRYGAIASPMAPISITTVASPECRAASVNDPGNGARVPTGGPPWPTAATTSTSWTCTTRWATSLTVTAAESVRATSRSARSSWAR